MVLARRSDCRGSDWSRRGDDARLLHRNMSWPLSVQGSSYRVCLGCGIKRLFDEPTFTSYGPYSYD